MTWGSNELPRDKIRLEMELSYTWTRDEPADNPMAAFMLIEADLLRRTGLAPSSLMNPLSNEPTCPNDRVIYRDPSSYELDRGLGGGYYYRDDARRKVYCSQPLRQKFSRTIYEPEIRRDYPLKDGNNRLIPTEFPESLAPGPYVKSRFDLLPKDTISNLFDRITPSGLDRACQGSSRFETLCGDPDFIRQYLLDQGLTDLPKKGETACSNCVISIFPFNSTTLLEYYLKNTRFSSDLGRN